MGSSFRSLPFLLFGSFTNVVVVAGLGTVVAYSLAAAERDAERSFILGWFVGLWFPLSAQIGWISWPTGCSRTRPPSFTFANRLSPAAGAIIILA